MMKFLILLTAVVATQAQTFVPQDTPEVAAAKAAHFAALAKAGQAAGVLYYPRGTLSIGTPVVTADGFIADTPEVAAAKAAHFAALAKAGQAAGVLYYPRGTLSIGTPVVTADGFIPDTPEVAAAKAAHFALKDQATAAAARASSDVSAPVYALPPAPAPQTVFYSYPVYNYAAPRGAYYNPHSAPAAAPVYITPEGFVVDTPEVSAAKIAHYTAYIDRLLGIS